MTILASRPATTRAPIRWWRDDGWLALVGPALVFLACLLYGAMLPQTALTFCLIWGSLAGFCLVRPRLRADLLRLEALALPASAFAVVILVAIWSLTPYVPGGPHPTWAYLGVSPGAATIDRSATVLETLKLLGLGCVFVVGAMSGGSDGRARLAIHALVTLGAAYAVWAFLAFVSTRASGAARLEASFLSANTAGTAFAVLFVLAAGVFASQVRGDGRGRLTAVVLPAMAALLFLVCLCMTASRGAFIGALAGLATFVGLQMLLGRARPSRALLAGGGAAVVLLVCVLVAGDLLLSRLVGSVEAVASRNTIAEIHLDAFLTSPLMGFGLGTFDTVNRTLLDAASFPEVWSARAAHNLYLGWLEQAGLLGAIPMFGCVAALTVTTARRAAHRARATNLIFALIAADVVFLTHGVSDFALEMFAVSALWAYLLGLQFGLAQGSSTR